MRLDWADNIRFIATVCVIILHTSATGLYLLNDVSITNWWIANAVNSGTRFALPFFFLLSGALNLNNNYSTFTFYKKRFFRVFIPFLFWGILFSTAFFTYYLIDNRPVSIFLLLKDFVFYQGVFRVQEYHLWFLYVLIGIYIITPLIKLFTNKLTNLKIILFFIFWTIILIINTFDIKTDTLLFIFRFLAYTSYYTAGYILYKTKPIIKNKFPNLSIYITSVAFMATSTYYLTKNDGLLNEHFNQTASITVFIQTLALYFFIIQLNLKKNTYKLIRDEINRYGLGIYIIHATVLSIMEQTGLDWNFIHPLLGIPITSIICIFVSYFIIRSMHKIPWLRYVAG